MEDILTVLPFGGTVDLVQIKGSTVKKAFEHAVHRYGSMSGEFLQVSGLFSGSLFILPSFFLLILCLPQSLFNLIANKLATS